MLTEANLPGTAAFSDPSLDGLACLLGSCCALLGGARKRSVFWGFVLRVVHAKDKNSKNCSLPGTAALLGPSLDGLDCLVGSCCALLRAEKSSLPLGEGNAPSSKSLPSSSACSVRLCAVSAVSAEICLARRHFRTLPWTALTAFWALMCAFQGLKSVPASGEKKCTFVGDSCV